MLTSKEKQCIKKLLALAPEPKDTLTNNEITGFMFGLAMTPDIVSPSEWLPVIFGGEMPLFDSMEQMEQLTGGMMQLLNRLTAAFHHSKLKFPFTIEKLSQKDFSILLAWAFGFEEALSLRENIWDPRSFRELSDKQREKLFFSRMIPLALVEPEEVKDFLAPLPESFFDGAFASIPTEGVEKEAMLQIMLICSLPQAVSTLQQHAQKVEKTHQHTLDDYDAPDPARSNKVGRNEPCPCNSGKKFKNCCGGNKDAGRSPGTTSPPARQSKVIQGNFPDHHKKKTPPATVYQLKVGLKGAKPPIWRRIQVPASTTLAQLHDIIQICMGWADCHLHQFVINKTTYSPPIKEETFFPNRSKNEANFTLQDLAAEIQPRFQYIYDFGDDWLHQITVEKTLPLNEAQPSPLLLTGRRTCPPEDIGGLHRYMHVLNVVTDPEDEEHEEMAEWLGEDFDPARFNKDDIAKINKLLRKLYPGS